jgi:hypothetical protein
MWRCFGSAGGSLSPTTAHVAQDHLIPLELDQYNQHPSIAGLGEFER